MAPMSEPDGVASRLTGMMWRDGHIVREDIALGEIASLAHDPTCVVWVDLLNPAPADPTQQAIFAWMPWIFMFMLGSFASGLVLYWIANNTITFLQQYTIMSMHGKRPDIFGNIRSAKTARVEAKAKAAPANSPTPPVKKTGKK